MPALTEMPESAQPAKLPPSSHAVILQTLSQHDSVLQLRREREVAATCSDLTTLQENGAALKTTLEAIDQKVNTSKMNALIGADEQTATRLNQLSEQNQAIQTTLAAWIEKLTAFLEGYLDATKKRAELKEQLTDTSLDHANKQALRESLEELEKQLKTDEKSLATFKQESQKMTDDTGQLEKKAATQLSETTFHAAAKQEEAQTMRQPKPPG